MKKVLAFTSAIVLSAALVSCGGDDGDGGSGGSDAASYCDQIENLQGDFNELDFTALTEDSFDELRGSIDDLEAAAPDDIKPDWGTLGDALDQFKGVLEDAGLTLDDLQAISEDPNNLPEDVDLSALQQVATDMNEIAENGDFEAAGDAITEQVKDECDIDLDATDTESTN